MYTPTDRVVSHYVQEVEASGSQEEGFRTVGTVTTS